jgi:hypothetical protein
MQQILNIQKPERLPFLEAVCWDLDDINHLDQDEMLNRYERGWAYRGVLADLEGEEKVFLQQLAKAKGSWLQVNV